MGHRARQNLLGKGFSRQQIDRLFKIQQKNRDLSRTEGFKIKRDEGIPLSIFDRQQEQKIKQRKRFVNQTQQNVKLISFSDTLKDIKAKQQLRAENSNIIMNALKRFNVARSNKQVIPIRKFTRSEEIKPRNIALVSNLARRGIVFNF